MLCNANTRSNTCAWYGIGAHVALRHGIRLGRSGVAIVFGMARSPASGWTSPTRTNPAPCWSILDLGRLRRPGTPNPNQRAPLPSHCPARFCQVTTARACGRCNLRIRARAQCSFAFLDLYWTFHVEDVDVAHFNVDRLAGHAVPQRDINQRPPVGVVVKLDDHRDLPTVQLKVSRPAQKPRVHAFSLEVNPHRKLAAASKV